MGGPHFLALDAGTGSGRAAVFDADGRLLACAQREWSYDLAHFPGDFMPGYQFDAERFWSMLCGATRDALARSGVAPGTIAGIAATSQREGSVFLDEAGNELLATPNFDARGFMEGIDVIEKLGGPERLYRLTGHSPPFIFPLSRLLWWRKRFPERPVACSLMISDWVTYRLTGERVAEPSNAVESLFFDVEKREWSEEIRAAFDIAPSVLPRLLPAGARAGSVTRAAALATGLLEGTPVFTVGADTQCALLGSGVVEPHTAAAVIGTTTPVQLVLDAPAFDTERQLWAGCHVVPDRWVLESNAGDTGKAYLWLLEMLEIRPANAADYARLEAEAERANPEVPVFAFVGPSIFDLRNLNPSRAAGLLFPYPFGRPRPSRADLLAGLLESIAYAVKANIEQLEAATGRTIERLAISGGMTRSRLLVRLLSQVTGIPLDLSTVAESAALGCAMLSGTGAGVYPDLRAAVARAVRHETIPVTDSGPYRDRYEKWRALFATLNGMTIA